jgi:peptidoglycan/xylan/chitin deacetylase (PgdA/CDA1 family)
MDPFAAGEEAEPSGPVTTNNPQYFLSLFIVLFLLACREKGEGTQAIKGAGPDSTAIRSKGITGNRQPAPDSFVQAAHYKMKVYLTFDDGPNVGTMNVIDAVLAEQVPASFFVVAKHVYDSREQYETWEKLKNTPGIELCNHSYSHAGNRYSRFYDHPHNVIMDFIRSHDSLQFQNKVARMPGRNAWRIDSIRHTDVKSSRDAIDSVQQAGFSIIGWDLEWDFDHKTFIPDTDTALFFRRIDNLFRDEATRTPGHLVILAHDQAFRTEADIQLLRAVLARLKNHPDYELVLASKYPGVK